MDEDLVEFMTENDGVATVTELAEFYDVPETRVRRWARANGVRRAGATFVFSADRAQDFGDELYGEFGEEVDCDDDDGDYEEAEYPEDDE